MNTSRTTALLIAAAIAAALTGCAAAPASEFLTALTASPSASPTPEPIAGDEDGDGFLTEREKQVLAMNSPRDYVLPDGTVTVIEPGLPLPPAVVDAIRGPVPGIASGFGDLTKPASKDLHAHTDAQALATGRAIAIVFYTHGTVDDRGWLAVASNKKGGYIKAQFTKDDAVAVAGERATREGAELIVVG